MATLKKNRSAQYPLVQDFTWTFGDAMLNTAGALVNMKAAGSATFEPIGLPPGAIVTGGELVVNTVSNDTGAATVSVGDSASAARYLAATSVKAAGRTALVPTGYNGLGEDLRITVANANGDATTGSYTLRVQYVIAGRSQEVQTN